MEWQRPSDEIAGPGVPPGRDVGAVVHALRILRFLAGSPGPHGVAAISRGTGVSPSTSFNILRTLTRARFVAFETATKTYGLGLGVAELASAMAGTPRPDLIRPELERLALSHRVVAALWQVTEDDHIVLVDRAYGDLALRPEMRERLRLPMLAGAVGRAVAGALALPEADLRTRFAALRWEDPPTFREYLAEVRRGRERGWTLDRGQLYRGIVSVAATASDRDGRPRFGFSGIAIAGQLPEERLSALGEELRDLARLVERSLFGGAEAVPGRRVVTRDGTR